jgi:DNA-binding NtrC family response regulator
VILLADPVRAALRGEEMARSSPRWSREARNALLAHSWPGNIRELSNAIERALIVNDGGPIKRRAAGLGPATTMRAGTAAAEGSGTGGGAATLPDLERKLVVEALAKCRGNKSRAAAILGVTRSQVYTLLKRFEIEP